MRFIICGAGGLGSVIGAMLARCGEDVTLVGRVGTASGWSVSTLGLPLTFPDGLEVRAGAVNCILLARDFLKAYKAMGYQPQNFYAPMGQFREYDSLPFD